jgi:sec-independent protein translocase protein TatA
MLPNVGWMEMAILFVIVLIIFGPKSLPKIGQALGRGIREFKDAARGLTDMSDDDTSQTKPSTPAPQVSKDAAASTPTTDSKPAENHV